MSVITAASAEFAYRGYEYYEAQAVKRLEKTEDGPLQVLFDGPDWKYERFIRDYVALPYENN